MGTIELTARRVVSHAEEYCRAYVECEGGCGETLEGNGDTPGQARDDLRRAARESKWVLADLGSEGMWPRCPECAEREEAE